MEKTTNSFRLTRFALFIKGIPYSVDETTLQDFFSDIGPVAGCSIARDSMGESKGFGFIKYQNKDDSARAIEKFHRSKFLGRRLIVEPPQPKEREERSPKSKDEKPTDKKSTDQKPKNFKSHYEKKKALGDSVEMEVLSEMFGIDEIIEDSEIPTNKKEKEQQRRKEREKRKEKEREKRKEKEREKRKDKEREKRKEKERKKQSKTHQGKELSKENKDINKFGFDSNAKIIVRNAPFQLTKKEVLKVFRKVGDVYDVFFPKGKKGFFFV
ncbi:RNA-binding protein [Anaeramoeba flamelloides]|uniref:RNA-binding protein n=1 Tax=Anaeramoeba flamelloides TaxID=1746091 RepID=A0ABQ8YYE9_9EUKA|nr:RNA-binding protein [Anaeramoeba flamelloides]